MTAAAVINKISYKYIYTIMHFIHYNINIIVNFTLKLVSILWVLSHLPPVKSGLNDLSPLEFGFNCPYLIGNALASKSSPEKTNTLKAGSPVCDTALTTS